MQWRTIVWKNFDCQFKKCFRIFLLLCQQFVMEFPPWTSLEFYCAVIIAIIICVSLKASFKEKVRYGYKLHTQNSALVDTPWSTMQNSMKWCGSSYTGAGWWHKLRLHKTLIKNRACLCLHFPFHSFVIFLLSLRLVTSLFYYKCCNL